MILDEIDGLISDAAQRGDRVAAATLARIGEAMRGYADYGEFVLEDDDRALAFVKWQRERRAAERTER